MFSSTQRFEKIKALQKSPEHIRNICIIAHVDHGKTTLADCLLSSNNIISRKLAGKLRYLDSRPDEQERRITMKSSSISLIFNLEGKEHLINLIDSPGHVEFSSEVASALRLCDGALILVDALEGVSSQTLHVLKKAFEEKVQTILVINKIDRLINELKMTPDEAYRHITVIIDEMNVALSSYISTDIKFAHAQENKGEDKEKGEGDQQQQDANLQIDEKILEEFEKKVYFSPEKNNVLFTSAVDCWCFDALAFAKILAARLGCKPRALLKYMWGEYYLDIKNKKLHKSQYHSKAKPIFVQFVLESLWKVYETFEEADLEKVQKIAKSLAIPLPDNFPDLLSKDSKSALNVFMWKWLPIDEIILRNVIELLPSPIQSQKIRLPRICKKLLTFEKEYKGYSEEEKAKLQRIKEAVETCDNSPDAPIVIYISKMINVPKENINEHGLVPHSKMNYDTKFVGFARIFSGVLKRDSEVVVISARSKNTKGNEYAFDKKNDENITAKIDTLYLQFSQYLEGIPEISAGNCFAIGDLENALYKTATVSNMSICPSFSPMTFGAMSLLKVAISTKDLNAQPLLFAGLKKLNKSDPSVEIYYNENGDLILSTCGEVHLERCVRDLETVYAKVEVKTSEPIVSFRETVINESLTSVQAVIQQAEKVVYEKPSINKGERREKKERTKKVFEGIAQDDDEDEVEFVEDSGVMAAEDEVPKSDFIIRNQPKNLVSKNFAKIQLKSNKLNTLDVKKKTNVFECVTSNQRFSVRIRCIALKYEVSKWLESKSSKMRKIFATDHTHADKEEIEGFIEELNKLLKENETDASIIELINNNLVSFGPRKYGPNMLLNKLLKPHQSLFHRILNKEPEKEEGDEELKENEKDLKSEKASSITNSKVVKLGRKTQEILKEYYRLSFDELSNAIASGFDVATSAGPLCEEPMIGVCYIVEDFRFLEESLNKTDKGQDKQEEDEKEKEKEQEIQRLKEFLKERERERAQAKAEAEAAAKEKARLRALKKDYELLEEEFKEEEYSDDEEEGEKKEDGQEEKKEEVKQEGEGDKQENKETVKVDAVAEEKQEKKEEKVEEKPKVETEVKESENVENPEKKAETELKSPEKEARTRKELESPSKSEKKNQKAGNGESKNGAEQEEQKVGETLTRWIMNDPYGPISGQIMSAAKESCLESFLGAEPRLVEAVYLCHLQVPMEQIGPVYDVLNKRRATVVQEDINEMNNLTVIKAHLPVNESFGLYSEMWRKTSGSVNPQLEFDTWRILEVDPFYIPETEEDKEEFGESGIVHNLAKNLIVKIRRRKGLQTEEKIVAAAEKQRTLAKKK